MHKNRLVLVDTRRLHARAVPSVVQTPPPWVTGHSPMISEKKYQPIFSSRRMRKFSSGVEPISAVEVSVMMAGLSRASLRRRDVHAVGLLKRLVAVEIHDIDMVEHPSDVGVIADPDGRGMRAVELRT